MTDSVRQAPHNSLDSRANDYNRVLRLLFISQDGDYGCGFNRIMLHLCGSTRTTTNMEAARQRGSLAVDRLVVDGLVSVRTFIGMEEFCLTEHGRAVASRLKV